MLSHVLINQAFVIFFSHFQNGNMYLAALEVKCA